MKPKTLEELNRIYNEAEEVDRELFAEYRSNLLLIAGDHYSKLNARISSQVRTSQSQATEQKLRLTKNHMHKVHRSYYTAILSEAPDTTIKPQLDRELQDQKDAELNLAVWEDIKYKAEMRDTRIPQWAKQFVGIGEVAVKIFWDYSAGEFLGYQQAVDEETGQPLFDEMGQPQPDEEKPQFTGGVVFEDIYGFNLMREAGTQEMTERGRCWIIRKMVSLEDLKSQYADDEEIVKSLQEEKDTTYVVFDAQKASYEKRKGQVMVREFYWEPCLEYPEGYFQYATRSVILEEDVLPEGIFPIVWKGFDVHPTAPRGRAILKVARPYQAEINRASSQMAVAQVSLGDDKILYQAGSKLAPGALLPGVRGIAYQGATPTVLPGRTGAQYLDYVSAQIAEMYSVLMLEENEVLDQSGQVDPYALLFRAASRKRKYGPYIQAFESFLVKVTQKALRVAKAYLPDDALINAVGRREQINIAEFRKSTDLNTQIKVEPRADTLETQFGQQLTFQHILQYAGKDLDKRMMGKILKNLPFANFKDSFNDLTIDEDVARNEKLALERGEQVEPTPYVDAEYMTRALSARRKDPDFKFLAPQIQQNYAMLLQGYEQILAAQEQKMLAAKNEYIPVDGALVTCDFYVPDPSNPENQAKRAKVPQRAMEWLLKRLEEQGMSLDKMEGMNATALSDMAEMLLSQRGQAQGNPRMVAGVPPQRVG